MAESNFLKEHALSWIAAWNRHDVERILSHYTDNSFSSRDGGPALELIRRCAARQGGVAVYFAKGLELAPDLHFDFEEHLSSSWRIRGALLPQQRQPSDRRGRARQEQTHLSRAGVREPSQHAPLNVDSQIEQSGIRALNKT
jgi:hypothetical protein